MKTVDLEDLTKEELYDVAVKYRDRWMKIKKSPRDLERSRLMTALAIEASALALISIKGVDTRAVDGRAEDGEIDSRLRRIKELHEELITVRGQMIFSNTGERHE
jgi:hypothetical protein